MAALESSKNKASNILLRYGYVWNRKTARGRSQVDMDQGIRFLGEIGRFGRRACEGGLDFCVQTVEENRERVRALYVACCDGKWGGREGCYPL